MRVLLLLAPLLFTVHAADWRQFRGPNGSGLSTETGLPVEMSPTKNLVWKTTLPGGYSSPVVTANRIFLTAREDDILYTFCLDRATGKELWRREGGRTPVPKPKPARIPAAPTPVTDGANVYVVFDEFGLISYDAAGNERWKLALAPFNTPYGFASSPVLAGNRLLLVADLDAGSYLLALDKDTGKQLWKTVRREATHGYPSPVIYQPVNAAPQVIVSGSFQLASYSLATGEKLWWVDGLAWQAKSMPLIHNQTIYVHSWMASLSEIGLKENVPPFQQMLTQNDADKDGKLSADEVPDPEMKKYWFLFDLDKDNFITAYDWNIHLSRSQARNGLLAIKPGTKGDVSSSNILWRYEKSLPNIPSPVIYNSVLFVLKEGGILTSLDPATGSVLKQGRVEGALGSYFSSPVAADGKLYLLSKDGKLAVLKAAADWELLQLNDLGEDCWGTPAIADGKIYVRTMQALYCFAAPVA